jgi:orotate phosphoribosyltransferase
VTADARARLLHLLRRDAYRAGAYALTSGVTSDFFIDCKRVVLTAEGHALVGDVLCDALARLPPVAAVAGVAVGGCPLASAVALTSYRRGAPLDALYVRREPKGHGTFARVEGRAPPGATVALFEDVLTTGGSATRAIDALRLAGYRVAVVLALVDRRQGGVAALRGFGVRVESVFAREDFIP